jgi:hypothetical protein
MSSRERKSGPTTVVREEKKTSGRGSDSSSSSSSSSSSGSSSSSSSPTPMQTLHNIKDVERVIKENKGKYAVVVQWSLEKCPPCAELYALLEKESRRNSRVKFYKILFTRKNVEASPYTSFPTTVVYNKSGGLVKTVTGANYHEIISST